jgi:hypothetical protein
MDRGYKSVDACKRMWSRIDMNRDRGWNPSRRRLVRFACFYRSVGLRTLLPKADVTDSTGGRQSRMACGKEKNTVGMYLHE